MPLAAATAVSADAAAGAGAGAGAAAVAQTASVACQGAGSQMHTIFAALIFKIVIASY